MALHMISTTVSDIGLVRKDNQDSTFAGARLVAVCDGMGGHAGGDTASTIAIRSLAHIENIPLVTNPSKAVDDVASMLTTSIIAAHDAIVGKARREKALSGMGTTVTAIALVGEYWVIAHIGDSRAYLVRDSEIVRVTKDHSYVQHLIDAGRITIDEAKSHPQRNVVMRVLGDFDIDPRPDISIRRAQRGDRWLLCSDGLSGVVSDESLRDILLTHPHAQECAQTLVGLAEKSGSTDNISVVIADSYSADDENIPTALSNSSDEMCLIAGAVSTQPQPIADTLNTLVAIAPRFVPDDILQSPAVRAAQLTAKAHESKEQNSEDADTLFGVATIHEHEHNDLIADDFDARYEIERIVRPNTMLNNENDADGIMEATGEIPVVTKHDGSVVDDPHDPDVRDAMKVQKITDAHNQHRSTRIRRIIWFVITVAAIIAAGIGCWLTYNWSQSRYFIKDFNGQVAIYQGVNTDVFGYSLNHVLEKTNVDMRDLPQGWQDRISKGIEAQNYKDARNTITSIQKQASSANENSTEKSTENSKDTDNKSSEQAGTDEN